MNSFAEPIMIWHTLLGVAVGISLAILLLVSLLYSTQRAVQGAWLPLLVSFLVRRVTAVLVLGWLATVGPVALLGGAISLVLVHHAYCRFKVIRT